MTYHKVTDVMRYWKSTGGKVILREHEGAMWWTDRYVLMRVDECHAVTDTFDLFNLKPEPGRYEAGKVLRRIGDTSPDVGPLLALTGDAKPVTQRIIRRNHVYVSSNPSTAEQWLAVCDLGVSGDDGPLVYLGKTMLDWFDSSCEMWGTAPNKPVIFRRMVRGDGKDELRTVGCVMPVVVKA